MTDNIGDSATGTGNGDRTADGDDVAEPAGAGGGYGHYGDDDENRDDGDRAIVAGATGSGQPGPGTRYFVTVIAPGRDALTALRQHDLDLFKPTARTDTANTDTFRVDGLLTLDEIGRLVSAGYRVLVQEDAAQKARGQLAPRATARGGAIGFAEWLAGMEDKPGRKG